jgi:WD40 repeat protein/transcriptional regulator with XRE-family HTH domain
VGGQPVADFAGLLRLLRERALLTQEELAEAAGLSPRAVSDLERGIHRTARKDTAVLLAGALGLSGPAWELFVASARGRVPAAQVLAAGSGLPGAAGVPGPGAGERQGSPYRGLKAFGEQDAGLFFGREAATTAVVDRMAALLAGPGVLVVSGASGAGKSSLLAAGVLPRLRAAGLAEEPGAAWWPQLVCTPTRAPLDELALHVAALTGADAAGVARELAAHPEGFALTARQAAMARPREPAGAPMAGRHQQRRLVLVVDQFEELFTQCDQEAHRRAFIIALHAAATTGHGPGQTPAALVVLGVRADFETRCADYPPLANAVQDRYLVTAMTERQLRLAITEPAKTAGSTVDDDLVAVLLAEVANGQPGTTGAGALPLLSHALDQAWRHRAGQTVTLADYERTGGIEGAVAASAQRAYDALTPAQQATARQVFTRLAATSTDGTDTADRATRADLTTGKTPAEATDVEAVLEAFAAERLLTLAAGTVELSHEILLTAWPLLRDTWLADTHADRITRTRLHHTATEWDHHHRDPSYLYTGTLLQAATSAATRITADPTRHPPLSPTETDFLHASDHTHQRTVRRRQAVIAGLLALTLIATATAVIAVRNAASATRQHAIALSRQLAADSLSIDPTEPVTARRLAVAAWRVFPTSLASSAMATLLTEQQQNGILPADPAAVDAVAFSPNGRLLASAGDDGTVRLWNPATGQPAGRPIRVDTKAQSSVFGVAFSPDGKLLASADTDGTVRLWNPATGQPAGRPIRVDTKAQSGVFGVAFSPSGKLLASADGDGTVRLWNPATGQPIGTPLTADPGSHTGVLGVAFSFNGKLLASADLDGTVRLWNVATRQPISRPIPADTRTGPNGGVFGVAFSPDGKLLASADADGMVRLWNPATGRPVGTPLNALTGPNRGLLGVAFSPNGKLLASADGDGTVRLWNPATRRPVSRPIPVGTSPTGGESGVVAFNPNGKLLASADLDGTVRLWNPATDHPVGAPITVGPGGPNGGVSGVAFSAKGKLLASADADGTMRLWNPTTGQPIGKPLIVSSQGSVTAVAFSPGGELLASNPQGTVRLWNLATGRSVGTALPAGPGGPNGGVSGVAFSPNGKLLASAYGDGTVRLWNPATRSPIGTPFPAHTNYKDYISGVAFSPNAKLLASADADGTVRLWNPATRRLVGVPLPAGPGVPNGGVSGVAFSPNGKLLASADAGGTVRLWDLATGQPIGIPLNTGTSAQGGALGVAFSSNSKLLASAGRDGMVRLWNPATGQPVGVPIPADTGQYGSVTAVAFSPDSELLASADADGTVRLWQVSPFAHPYAALCLDVGPPTRQDWSKYAAGEPQPKICA